MSFLAVLGYTTLVLSFLALLWFWFGLCLSKMDAKDLIALGIYGSIGFGVVILSLLIWAIQKAFT